MEKELIISPVYADTRRGREIAREKRIFFILLYIVKE